MKICVKSEKSDIGKRLDIFLSAKIANLSRSQIKKLIESGSLRKNGKILNDPSAKIKNEEIFELEYETESNNTLKPVKIPLDIIYEDEHLLVINKAPGIAVHLGSGEQNPTIVNALIANFANFAEAFADKLRPGIVHRLDKDTSGCLIIAKNEKIREKLSKKFATRNIEKIYLAITYGVPKEKYGLIDTFFGRHPVIRHKMAVLKEGWRKAVTEYKTLREFSFQSQRCALLELNIKTGRTHQIRVHLAHIKSPVWGDKVYGGKQSITAPRQLLHAWKIKLLHPVSEKEIGIESPIPEDMQKILDYSEPPSSSDRAFNISG